MGKGKLPRHLGDVLVEVYRTAGLREAFDQYSALRVWNTVVGDTIARVTKVEQIKDGDLYVRVKSPSWRMELNFRKKEIMQRLNSKLGSNQVKMIIFR